MRRDGDEDQKRNSAYGKRLRGERSRTQQHGQQIKVAEKPDQANFPSERRICWFLGI